MWLSCATEKKADDFQIFINHGNVILIFNLLLQYKLLLNDTLFDIRIITCVSISF